MPVAYSAIPTRFMDPRVSTDGRYEAFRDGIKRHGFKFRQEDTPTPKGRKDVFLTWNLHRPPHLAAAKRFEEAGARVIVCEEAYTRFLRPDLVHFAMGVGGHNGSGKWPEPQHDRWSELGINLMPWRVSGGHILVCCARGMGSPEMSEPGAKWSRDQRHSWRKDVVRRLREKTDRPIVVRDHPGKERQGPPLAEQLANAHAVVVWGSNCATEALVRGVPVFYEAPHIAAEGACKRGIDMIETPPLPARLPALERLAWGQWAREEIASGLAYEYLLNG